MLLFRFETVAIVAMRPWLVSLLKMCYKKEGIFLFEMVAMVAMRLSLITP